jgi:hypothetical protein
MNDLFATERRVLQVMLGVLSLIPIVGLVLSWGPGPDVFLREGASVSVDLDNQWRYLSGVYASVSIVIWWTIPHVEARLAPLRIALFGVMLGGVGRLVSIVHRGLPDEPTLIGGLVLELGLAPLLLIWQNRIHRGYVPAN